ncbi:cell division protein Fic [[Actinobacillus] muris]|uniref:Cell division protein Fic n=2 Tax=Muribacter muris TaxID=67855 RepID=A0A0J5S3B5_9PAST|nr:Fic family protein [Muribacter muris]KMK51272.1 cell division protein Fic [[Actinobacillus] muris] [Muribacter muris]
MQLDDLSQYRFATLLKMLNSKRPLDAITAQKLEEHFYLKYNQQSNAIEGNSLTLIETKVLLENGITAKGKPFKDHLDIINHRNAIYYLKDLIKENNPLSEKQIKEFNYLLLKGTDYEYSAGKYRNVPVMIGGSEHIPPQPYLVQTEMDNLLINYHQSTSALPHSDEFLDIKCIARLHADFVHIHPFTDGNGRTGRLLMNLELIKRGYPLAIISDSDRIEYYQALSQADKRNYEEIECFLLETIKRTLCDTLNVVFPDWQHHYLND